MKENEIRPAVLFDAYLQAAREDIEIFFREKSHFISVPCPACGADKPSGKFVKDSFSYVECDGCQTLYVSPRPTREMFDRFYRESKSSKFWVERFYKETEEVRREKMFRPRAQDVVEKAKTFLKGKRKASFVDVGSGYGTFLEELRRLNYFESSSGIEPCGALAEVCEGKGFPVVRSTVENADVKDRFDMATTFELFEHVYAPVEFLRSVHRLLVHRGILYMTTLSGKGFDLLLLKERSKSISPPHHINFINPQSLGTCLQRAGFEVLEINTPGKLDVDIVLNSHREKAIECDPFSQRVLFESDEKTRENFQAFLQQNELSSHIRAIARKL